MPLLPLLPPYAVRRCRAITALGVRGALAVMLLATTTHPAVGATGPGAAPVAAVDSLEQVEQRLRETPQDASLRFSQARLLEAAGRRVEAAQAWQRMTEDFPQLAEPFNNLAVRRAAEGDLDAARRLLEQALARDPNYRLARLNLAELLLAQAHRAACQAAGPGPHDAALDSRLQALATLRGVDPACPPAWRGPASAQPR